MATEVWPELTNIQDEDVLRRMWQETEDFGRKKEIRARMYKLREQRLKDFYTTGDSQSEVTVRKTKTHTESIGDQGSFLTMKTKEIRDSESPTRDISCARRGDTWSSSYSEKNVGVKSDNTGVIQVHQSQVPAESMEIIESSTATSGKVSSKKVSQTSSVQTSKVSSQSRVQSSNSEIDTYRSGDSQIASSQDLATNSSLRQMSSENNIADSKSESHRVTSQRVSSVTSGSQRVSSESRIQQGGEQTVTTRTIKQGQSGSPGEVVTTTVTTYTTSDSTHPSVDQKSDILIQKNNQVQNTRLGTDQNRSSKVETTTVIKSEPQITYGLTESVTRNQQMQQNQQVHQSSSTSYSTQSVSSSIQKAATSVEKQSQNISISNKTADNQLLGTAAVSSRDMTTSQTSTTANESQRYINQEQTDVNKTVSTEDRAIESLKKQNVHKSDNVQITEVRGQDLNLKNKEQLTKDSRRDNLMQEVIKTSDTVDSIKKIQATDEQTARSQSVNRTQNEEVRVKSSTSTTDQKIMNEIQKLDTFLSTQPTPSNSVPISPQSAIDTSWPVDKEFVYTDTTPRDKVMVNGERSSPIKHPTNLELPKGATEGQYVTTYQHDYSPRISRDHDTNHQYFASTLRASPDRSSPSPSKRSSSKGSLDRSTPDRKFRGSPTRKTPDNERRLSSSSYTIERISDNKRYTSDVTEKSQTLPKDSKPKRKLSSTQTKAANKTRVSTPGVSPTTSPTRIQRGRKPSLSDSDSDHSNATFNKSTTSVQKISDTDEIKKYGSTTRIRGSSTSVNVTDNETRLFSSPSPTRYPARENTPDYSSEGSITRELRIARNTEKSSTTLDSSPERSAFSPIKSFRTSPERKDQTLNLINEERKYIHQTTITSDEGVDEVDVNERVERRFDDNTRISKVHDKPGVIPNSSPDRRSKDRTSSTVTTETISVTKKQNHSTPTSSPERHIKKDRSEPKKRGGEPQKKPRTPLNSPERRSPSKPEKNLSSDRSPSKPKYYSGLSPTNKAPGYPKNRSTTSVTEKTTVVKKITKTSDGDRITRRSSIPRADIKSSPRRTGEPDNKTKPSFSRDTASSTKRTTTTTISPVTQHTAKIKSVDRSTLSHAKEAKSPFPRKQDTPVTKRPITKKLSHDTTKHFPVEKDKPKTKAPMGSRKESPVKPINTLVNGRVDVVTKTTTTTKKEQLVNTSNKKTKKEITHTDSKEIIKNKLQELSPEDKDSSDSIEDEQPPEEFYDDFDDRDDKMQANQMTTDSTDFKHHESELLVTSTCETKKSDKAVSDIKVKQEFTDSSSKFINTEQSFSKPSKTIPVFQEPSKRKADSAKPNKPKDALKHTRKVKEDNSSSSSEEEGEILIQYDDYSDTKTNETTQKKLTKRNVSKETLFTDKTKVDSLKVIVQHPKSSRESSPEKSIPMSVTSDGGQTPRFADFVIEPEDVEVFDTTNLGPNRPIPSTVLDDNRIIEESDDSTRESEKVSVAERVSKYIEKTNKIDIVTLDSNRQNIESSSDIMKTKELFENKSKEISDETDTYERRGSKKYNDVSEFIQKEFHDTTRATEVTTKESPIDTVDKVTLSSVKESIQQPETPKTHKPSPKKQPSSEEIVKGSERRLSEHSPDIEVKKAFFEKKLKDVVVTDSVKPIPAKEPIKSSTPFDQKRPNYMKATATAASRKETIQREFAPVKQDTDKDQLLSGREKRSSIDIEKMDTFIKSEAYTVCKDTKVPSTQPAHQKDFPKYRRSSTEIQELDTFKKSEAYVVCDDRSKNVTEKRSSIDLQKNVTTNTVTKKDSTSVTTDKRKQSQTKSPERSPTRKTSKDKSSDRVPLKKKDTNIIIEEQRVSETSKTGGKFGVTLRRTSSSGTPTTQKPSQPEAVLPDDLPEIEEIFDLYILEILLTRAILYDERRRIRAQIRTVKKNLESEQNQQPSRRPQSGPKTERGTKEELYHRKQTNVEKTTRRTPSPVKDSKAPTSKSPERSVRTFVDRKDTPKGLEERRISTDKNSTTVHSVKSYVTPDKKYSVKETKTESHRIGSSPERRTTMTVETVTRKSTPYPAMATERKTSSSYQSRLESHSTYSRSSPERRIVKEEESRKTDTYSRSSPERRRTSTEFERRTSKSSPERKISDYDNRRTSETIKTYSRTSPERKFSKDSDIKSSFTTKTSQERTSDVRKTSRTSPERKVSTDYESRKTSVVKNHSRSSPERRLSTEITESSRSSSSHVTRTSSQYTTTTTSVGRKGEDSITSSYGVGPTDEQGRPLFGLRALRSTHRTSDDSGEIEVGEDVGDGLVEDVRGSDGRPLFGLKALKAVTTTNSSSTVTTSSEMPSTQHLVQKHQQFLSEVKTSEEKVRGEVPRARLRDSFILDSDEGATSVVPALTNTQGVSLKSIIQKHEDMATTGKHVRREVQSTKTVMSSHGTLSSDGKVSMTKHVIHGEMRGKDGAEPTGKITTSHYNYRSDDPSQKPHVTSTTTTTHLGSGPHRNSITSLGEVRIEEIKDSDSRRDSLVSSARRSLESKHKEDSKQTDQSWQSERKTVVKGDSIKALQHKFQQPTGVNQVNQKPSYPKAGLILRSNSLTQSDEQNELSSSLKCVGGEEVRTTKTEERRSSVKEDKDEATSRVTSRTTTSVSSTATRRDSGSGNNVSSTRHQTSTTVRDGSKSATSFLDDTSKVTGVQDILQRMRNADLVTENTDTTEDAEARSLLNKFLGASVILQGMEAGGAGPASSALVSQVERQRILTSTQRKTDDIDDITDEKQLQILLEACSDYEQRRKIRARLRKIMAERKGQGELLGGEEGEERRDGEFLGRWVEDSGTESGEERKGVEEAIEEVKSALERLATALPRLAGNVGGSVSDLVTKLQTCLNVPAPPPRRNKRRHHTVGVTPEEIAKARKWVEKPHPQQLTRCELKPIEHKVGYFVEPLPQTAVVTYNAPPLSKAPPITYDPSAVLFTPAQSVQIAVHKAAIQKQISQEESKVHRSIFQRQKSQEDLRSKESDSECSSDEEISPAKRLLKLASKRRTKTKIKRSNTVEIPRPATYCDSDTDDPAYSSDRSDLKRKSCGALFSQPPPFLPKTDNDLKFLNFLNKVNDSSSKVITYNPSARGGKHWSNRFSRIKTTFEDQSSDEKEKEIIPKGKVSPFLQQKCYTQQKLPWSVKQEGDVIVGSITVAKRAPGPVNQFTHAPMSAFKPVEKKPFPSSVSGSVKQLASEKFTPQPEITKPVPSIPPRTQSKFQPVIASDNSPLSQRFVPNKAIQPHPPAQAYVNQYSPDFSPKHFTCSSEKIPFKTPNKNQELKSDSAREIAIKPNQTSHNTGSTYHPENSYSDHGNLKNHYQYLDKKPKPETISKSVSNYTPTNVIYDSKDPPSQNNNQKPKQDLSSESYSSKKPFQSSVSAFYQPLNSEYQHQQKSKPESTVKHSSNLNQSNKQPVETNFHSHNSLNSDYNSNWTDHDFNQTKNSLSPPRDCRDSDSLSPHPYKGCYVYNENNEIISHSPYLTSNNANYHVPISPSYKEPIYQNISEVKQSENYFHSSDSLDKTKSSYNSHDLSIDEFKGSDKNHVSQFLPETGYTYSRNCDIKNKLVNQDSIQNQTLDINSPKFNTPGYYSQNSTLYKSLSSGSQPYLSHDDEIKNISHCYSNSRKGSNDSLDDCFQSSDYSTDYNIGKTSSHVVFNNCNGRGNDKKGLSSSNEGLDRLSPGFHNLSGMNSRGESPRGSDDWDDCIEEKAVVGRVMGETQCQRATTQSRRIDSRFPNAPSGANLLRTPPDQPKLPSPTLRSRQEHSPKSLSPSFPNVLHRSESWHQMVKEQMMQAKQAPPLPAKVVKTKSSHTLALPKQFEGALNPEAAHRLQNTVSQYLSKPGSTQKSSSNKCHSDHNLLPSEEIENVDEAFESIFQECSKKRSTK